MTVQRPAASNNRSWLTCWLTRRRYWHETVLRSLQVSKFRAFLVTASGVLWEMQRTRHRKDERLTSVCLPSIFSGVHLVSKNVWLPEHKTGWILEIDDGTVFVIVLSHPSNKGKAAWQAMEKYCYCSVQEAIMTYSLLIWEVVFQFSLML